MDDHQWLRLVAMPTRLRQEAVEANDQTEANRKHGDAAVIDAAIQRILEDQPDAAELVATMRYECERLSKRAAAAHHSTRDQIAAGVVAALVSGHDPDDAARLAYVFADAMMKAREVRDAKEI